MRLRQTTSAGLAAILISQAHPATIDVRPSEMLAGSHQRVTFDLTVGDLGLRAGGGMRVELPIAYLETGPLFWDRPQVDEPGARGFVAATASGDARLQVRVSGRWGGIVTCMVTAGAVEPGGSVRLDYTGVVQSLSWDWPVRAQWRSAGNNDWQDVESPPVIRIKPRKAATLLGVAPADVERDAAFDFAVVLLDKFGNRAAGYHGTVALACASGSAQLPAAYRFTAEDAGVHLFTGVRIDAPGFHKITLTDGVLEGRGNHCQVHEQPPVFRRFFGETHFHTGTGMKNQPFTTTSAGGDHRGQFTTQEAAYAYVRDVMRLDFASASEHDARGFDDRAWQQSMRIADAFYAPGRFTTFYGYEWTASATQGHHVVLYRDADCTVLDHFEHPSKAALCAALARQGKPALVIPHLMWVQPDHGMWDHVDNRYRRVGEIYSLWNNRFLLQPADQPQRFELGIDNRWSYQYAWHRGHRIGLVGSSDNHTGQPGANNHTIHTQHAGGLAAVWAADNNRAEVWDALHARRTYATTGTRILLDFRADDHWMGEEYATSRPPEFVVRVAGTHEIETVELVKYDGATFRTIRTVRPGSDVSEFQHTDHDLRADSMYYVRVLQVDEVWRSPWAYTTREMAWSSPIWINPAP